MENVLLATEIVKDYHKEDITPRCAMQIDISKAFDSVHPNKWRACRLLWEHKGIKTGLFSIPIPVYDLYEHSFKAAMEGKIGYHLACENLALGHFCFADDPMVFVKGYKLSIVGILQVFEEFAKHTGLHISIEKSTVYMSGIPDVVRAEILQEFPIEQGTLPSGQERNGKRAKVDWSVVCTPKQEGGLGLKALNQVNKVCMLKLIWRIMSARDSLLVNWVQRHLIGNGSIWRIRDSTTLGSWIWKKILKYRTTTINLYQLDIGDGARTSFWFDKWSKLSYLFDIFGDRGVIDLGIPLHASLESVWNRYRRGSNRNALLRQVEEEIKEKQRQQILHDEDVALWRGKGDTFRSTFSLKDIWEKF
ncbi:uncharacterized protein LOC112086028 [Eutrema salsugineum]|uniref:uncharacterized protein LOC112086028 n=1 Tax=Eutrema salsugineum TaxID=72664 RepID=UPI000CECEE13|nr:uncharacterized protein LOC112086028 [Eutrema salsugineum]